ncbi:hypothetical protein FV233_18035 [Methylobacterium sp. WL7]|nr:hypothetical protein FV233_18035 [Methylobacterium sp. WL7]
MATAVATGGAGGGTGTGGVATSRQILSGGLATGGGDLTADRTITVPKAAQSDVAAGTDDAKALTSLSVAARFALLAPLSSPALTGTPTAPTAAAGTNTTQLATTSFVGAAVAAIPAVQYAAQTLTTAQQAQARTNIGAGTGNGNGTASVTAYSISGASGYRRWSDGFIEQWGQTSVAGDTFITYPLTFPNACKSAVASPLGNTSDALSCMVDGIGQSSFGARVRDVAAGGGITSPTAIVAWHAVGY